MRYRLEFELLGLPRMTNPSGKSNHWRARHANTTLWKTSVGLAVGPRRPVKPLERAILILIRFSSVSPDPDGLVSGFKPVIDGLVQCGVLANDRWENIGMPTYHWEKCAAKKGRIRVIVESAKEGVSHVERRGIEEPIEAGGQAQ